MLFEFNSDWTGLSKKIVFTVDAELSTTPLPVYYLLLDDQGMCGIPREVLSPTWVGHKLLVGACGNKGTEVVLPTVWVSIGTIKEGAIGDPNIPSLQPNVYEELIAKIGELSNLTTDDKDSLVEAINEINEKLINTGEGGSYTLPVATKDTLGGVKIGPNINITSDGIISVESDSLFEESLVTPDETNEMLDEIFSSN